MAHLYTHLAALCQEKNFLNEKKGLLEMSESQLIFLVKLPAHRVRLPGRVAASGKRAKEILS